MVRFLQTGETAYGRGEWEGGANMKLVAACLQELCKDNANAISIELVVAVNLMQTNSLRSNILVEKEQEKKMH